MTALLKSTCKAGILVAACVSLALCASCTDKEALEGYAETDVLSFGVSVSNEWTPYTGTRSKAGEMPERSAFKFENSDMWLIATSEQKMDTTLFCKPKTRAAEVTNGHFHDSFGVYAYVYEGDNWAGGQNAKPYFLDEKVTESGNVWTTDPLRYWPGASYKMHFFAYAPYNSQGVIITTTTTNNTPVLNYSVPDEVTEQQDLVVATADVVGNHNQSVPLEFKHILTAVQVKTKDDCPEGPITSVRLKNVCKEGTYSFESETWSLATSKNDFEVSFDSGKTVKGATDVVTGENTFMMLPQDLEGVRLEVVLGSGESAKTLVADLQGKWTRGQMKVYSLSLSGNAGKGE